MRSLLVCCMFISICFLSLPYESFCEEDPQFEECKKDRFCGNHTIRFPFYTDENLSYCGYPGFGLTCLNNNVLLLNISQDQYRITEIFYPNNSFRVTNILSSRSGFCSLDKIRNLSLPSDRRFQLNSFANLTLLSDCEPEPPQTLSRYKVGCDPGKNVADWVLAMKTKDPELIYATAACKTVAGVPVRDYNEDDTDFLKMIRNGFDLEWVATNCSDCTNSGGYCGYQGEPDNKFQCFCDDRPHSRSCMITLSTGMNTLSTGMNARLKIGIGAGVVAVISIIFLVLLFFICYRRMKNRLSSYSYPKDVEAFIKKHGPATPKRFRYSTVKTITNSFKEELGKGGYGNVYKGKLPDGCVVAVKVLNATKGNGEEFMNEVASIGSTSHVNIVSLRGFVYEGKRRALIYEYMPNGSLEKFIHGTTPSLNGKYLGWEKLYSIALGISRGLEYLHCGCTTQILHFDIKPHNILLDEDFCPKISDFGLAKLYTRNESVLSSIMQARGTIGYIAPEVISRNFGPVSHKSDVYSYGMMILEMVGGRKNVNARAARTSEIYFPRWVYKHIHDNEETSSPNNITEEENHIARKMMIVGLWCIQTYPSQRPSISKVIEMFEGNLAALEIPPKPYMCSPPASPQNSQQKTLSRSSSSSEYNSSPRLVPRSYE